MRYPNILIISYYLYSYIKGLPCKYLSRENIISKYHTGAAKRKKVGTTIRGEIFRRL